METQERNFQHPLDCTNEDQRRRREDGPRHQVVPYLPWALPIDGFSGLLKAAPDPKAAPLPNEDPKVGEAPNVGAPPKVG